VQISEVLREVQNEFPALPRSQLTEFFETFRAIVHYAAVVLESGKFKPAALGDEKLNEKRDFQQHLIETCRMRLGPDLREAGEVTGGTLDVRYLNVIIEFKIERELSDRELIRSKYLAQPAQYRAVAFPVGILVILDLTQKRRPPANIANNISLETAYVHGFEQPDTQTYPTKIAVAIIDGNTEWPSSYSA